MLNVSKLFSSHSPLTYLFALLLSLVLAAGYLHPIAAITQDLGRHLLTGEIILQTKTVPHVNLFSYTYPLFPFINTHWLSEVVFFLLEKSLGFSGLLIITTGIMLLSYNLLFFFAKKKSGLIAIGIVSLLLFSVLFERTDLRPEIFSFFFLTLFLIVLYAYRVKQTKWIFLLPILLLLWVNIHIYFFIGLFVMGLFFLEMSIHERKNLGSKKFLTFLLVFIASAFVTVLNPNGIHGALYPFSVFNNYGYTIEENQTVFFIQSLFPKKSILFFEISVVLLFVSLCFSWKKVRLVDWLLAASFTVLGAMAIRNLPLFAIAIFIPFCEYLTILIRKCIHLIPKQYQRSSYPLSIALLLFFMGYLFFSTVSAKPIGIHVEKGAEGAVDYFLKNNMRGPLFNNFDIGSYVEYRLYPQEKVFVDGRPEAYPADFFKNSYIPMQENPEVFSSLSKQYGFTTVLFSHTDQTPWGETFMNWITKDPSWKMVYLDDTMMLLRKTDVATLLPAITDQSIHASPSDLRSLQQLAHFYSVVGWNNNLYAVLKKISALDPNNCPALYNLALLGQQNNDPTSSLYLQKYQTYCH